jgi:DNA/RNA-binding domain of Phe-tRNA-synthetase-like protein
MLLSSVRSPLAFAIPVAVFDVAEIAERVEVRYALGDESYLTFSGEIESPDPHEVIFADDAGRAHARRWTNRAEAMHRTALADIERLTASIAAELSATWSVTPESAILTQSSPRFEF